MQLNWPEPSDFPALAAEEVHVWVVPLAGIRTPYEQLQDLLSPAERDRARNFALDQPRNTFVVARAALRSLLGRYLDQSPADVQIVTDSNGKPRLVDGSWNFSLAHSGDLALIAVTRGGEIGVDVELLRTVDQLQEIAARNFHPVEWDAIRNAEPSQVSDQFLRCWTRKEAVLKAIGVGLGFPLDSFCMLTNGLGGGMVELPAHASLPSTHCRWHDLDPCAGYVAAVAALTPLLAVQGFTYSL